VAARYRTQSAQRQGCSQYRRLAGCCVDKRVRSATGPPGRLAIRYRQFPHLVRGYRVQDSHRVAVLLPTRGWPAPSSRLVPRSRHWRTFPGSMRTLRYGSHAPISAPTSSCERQPTSCTPPPHKEAPSFRAFRPIWVAADTKTHAEALMRPPPRIPLPSRAPGPPRLRDGQYQKVGLSNHDRIDLPGTGNGGPGGTPFPQCCPGVGNGQPAMDQSMRVRPLACPLREPGGPGPRSGCRTRRSRCSIPRCTSSASPPRNWSSPAPPPAAARGWTPGGPTPPCR